MDMPLVAVGNAGNAGEQSRLAYYGDETFYGGVDYTYRIGKFEATAGQYTEFLNAVAATDTYGLYNIYMWEPDPNDGDFGCKIARSGSSGNYTYSVAADWADRPVNYVSWGDAARFANWLTNGMPTGAQDLTTTEDGSYFLNGATSRAEIQVVTREADARYAIPSENEWYKAAYHRNDGVTGNYFTYPTSSDSVPNSDLVDPDPGNNANYRDYYGGGDYTIGPPYYRTEVGEFENSASPYGTFDQSANVWEWNEAIIASSRRGLRGMGFSGVPTNQAAWYRWQYDPTVSASNWGFRVVEVPEPALLTLMALGGLGLLRRRRQ
jgi:MYXO-CTERM domain-containing protein